MKEARLSVRIDDSTMREIDHYVAVGRYRNRSAFGTEAVKRQLAVEKREITDNNILHKIVDHLVIANSHPAHVIPEDILKKFRTYVRGREEWMI